MTGELLTQIGDRLRADAYLNEAAISHGIVIPIIASLGWDTADPDQVRPEFSNARGRVDFALLGPGRHPLVFIEVKALDNLDDADRQLFEYAFHTGVQLCVLTDGRKWAFYLPSGQGSYANRRIYLLNLEERLSEESGQILSTYLERQRVCDGSAMSAAQDEHRRAIAERSAAEALPAAWTRLVEEAESGLVDLLVERAEAVSGYRPTDQAALEFLESLHRGSPPSASGAQPVSAEPARGSKIEYRLYGRYRTADNASRALVAILSEIVNSDPSKLLELQEAVRSKKRAHVGRSAEEINPGRPELARPAPIYRGWYVGLTISNSTKMMILRAACAVYGLSMPHDLDIRLPNGS